MLQGIYGFMQILHEAGFVAELFDVRKLLEYDKDQITYACRSFYEKLIILTGKPRLKIKRVSRSRAYQKNKKNGSSQYALAETEIKSDASIGIQRMSLGPSGSSHLLYSAKDVKAESLSAAIRATEHDTLSIQVNMLSYIDNAMGGFEHRQQSQDGQAIFPNQTIKTPIVQEAYFADVETE